MDILPQFRRIVGASHVLSRPATTRRFRTGFRSPEGDCLAVVRPGTLLEFWRVLQCCADAGVAILVQAANTGLTGGSTPIGDYDRGIVVINTLRLDRVQLLMGGRQVLCHAGATLHRLERILAPLGREPHSVIGSSCIGASVVGGVCNNSGGALVRRGPAYTEMALFAHLDRTGKLRLVNHLGLALGDTPEAILTRLDDPGLAPDSLIDGVGKGSDDRYQHQVRQVDADTPARFNADPDRLFEASGSAGKVAVFAVRLDTFAEEKTRTFYVGTNQPVELTKLRRALLTGPGALPVAAEYIHSEAFDLADRYGKDMFMAIRLLGTRRLPMLYRFQARIDALAERLPGRPRHLSDRILQRLSRILPDHLPARMRDFRGKYRHHLLLRVSVDDVDTVSAALHATIGAGGGSCFLCTPDEDAKAFLHRFVTAGAAVRYRNVHPDTVEDVLALDIALRRNDDEWFETLPEAIDRWIEHRVYYGHFLCHVLHQDYILRKGADTSRIKQAMCQRLDARGAEYPAEHNVGHLYPAKPPLEAHYRALDPMNCFNPGIGRLTRAREWAEAGQPDWSEN